MPSVLRRSALIEVALGLIALVAVIAVASAEDLIIGVAGPQSGLGAVFGLDQARAAQLAAEIVNAKGGILAHSIKIIAKDSQNESTIADTQAFRDLLLRRDVVTTIYDFRIGA